jgi:branched-chain amino acid transport system ATP-binding protein
MTFSLNILETHDLTMRFGGITAIKEVNFTLEFGELRCLIGPNGAGKSTFFKCLTGQYMPSQGEVILRGHSVNGAGVDRIARSGVGIKTQVPSIFDGLDVRENIWLAARRIASRKKADDMTAESLEKLELTSIAGQLGGLLAHGQRQWVEMAMVTVGNPELVLLDEPTAGMTRDEVDQTAEFIKEINRTAAVVVVEHDMHFIRSIAKKVTVFHQGEILMEDDVEAVLRHPQVRDIYLGKSHVEGVDA